MWFLRMRRPFYSREGYKKRWQRLNQRNAELIYWAILKLQGLFIKVGQFMSLRVDVLPRAYTRILARLQDQVPPADYRLIKKRIIEELDKPPEEIFSWFREEPIAAASLGQVHEAMLKDGRRVAVKVQYPGIEKIVETDLRILKLILWWFGLFRKQFQSDVILNEFRRAISQEIDYIHEGKNAEKIAQLFADDPTVIIPQVIWEYTTKKVLVLEFLEGIKVTDIEKLDRAGINRAEVSRKVMDCYFRQMFKYGIFQADAHPGNIFVRPGPTLILLDFGLVKELPQMFLVNVGKLALGVTRRDEKLIAEAMERVGFVNLTGSKDGYQRFARIIVKYSRDVIYKNPKKINFQAIFNEIIDLVREYPIVSIPEDFILMGRVLGQLSGLGRQLKAKIEVDELVMPYLSAFWNE